MRKPRLKATLFAQHNGRRVWCEPHDREEHFLEYVYRLDCWHCGKIFDVRALPGYTEYPRFEPRDPKMWLDEFPAYFDAKQRHHAEIILRTMAAGTIDGAAVSSTKQPDLPSPKKRRARSKWDLELELVDWDLVVWLMKHHGLTEEEALMDAKTWA